MIEELMEMAIRVGWAYALILIACIILDKRWMVALATFLLPVFLLGMLIAAPLGWKPIYGGMVASMVVTLLAMWHVSRREMQRNRSHASAP